MDLNKIFIKGACPTKVGGQAVLEGIMMKGADRTAVVVRKPSGKLHMRTEALKKPLKIAKVPLIRGVFVFVDALVVGTRTLLYSASVLEEAEMEMEREQQEGQMEEGAEEQKPDWLTRTFGEKGAFNVMLYVSVAISIVFTVGIFIIGPTFIMGLVEKLTRNEILLNLIEGVLRIALFVIYVLAISRMKDIRNVFQYHGAEHACIHCFENGLPLTVENCKQFGTLHPRCGTSFLMFVMVISLLLFSLLGWPGLFWRITSRLLLVPVIAGISFELLRWAGSSVSPVVKILSLPGLALQQLTTIKPEERHLEVAITAMRAVLTSGETPQFEGELEWTAEEEEEEALPCC